VSCLTFCDAITLHCLNHDSRGHHAAWVGTQGLTMAWIFGTRGHDTMRGSTGDDLFFNSIGDDTMYGGYGNDTFYSGPGADNFFGEGGNDTVDYSAGAQAATPTWLGVDGVIVSLAEGWGVAATETGYDHYSSIENVTGSNYSDFIIGDGNANIIRGLSGNDFISGGGGADTLNGGNGIDWLGYDGSASRVVVDILNNTASGGDATGDTISGFENLSGSSFSDILSGTNGENIINGHGGNDTINGRGGNDTINGGEGNDTLTGGSGADTFVFDENTNSGSDVIKDFAAGDRIHFNYDGNGGFTTSYTFDTSTNGFDVTFDFANAGSVLLDNVAIGDLTAALNSVDFV
jgi:serralysin